MATPRQRVFLPPGAYRRAALDLLRGELWEGNDVARFEEAFASFIGVPDAVAVGSGRAGLRLLLQSLQLEPGCEVICSAFGYPVVPWLVHSMGYQLRFVDCELGTLGMDPEALEKAIGPKTGAVIATHLYGVPCRIDRIAASCETAGAKLVEDCAHCYGAAVGEVKAGAFGAGAYFSFETSKPINTMGGGMITTSDPAMAERIRQEIKNVHRRDLSWLAKRLGRTSFEALVTSSLVFNAAVYPALRMTSGKDEAPDRFASGYHGDEVTMKGKTGRFTNYQARLGLLQMERQGRLQERRRKNAVRLLDALRGTIPLQEPAGPEVTANFMLIAGLFEDLPTAARELLRRGIDTKHKYMRDCSGLFETEESFPNSERAEREVLHLPAHPELSPERIDEIARIVREVVAASSPGNLVGAGSTSGR